MTDEQPNLLEQALAVQQLIELHEAGTPLSLSEREQALRTIRRIAREAIENVASAVELPEPFDLRGFVTKTLDAIESVAQDLQEIEKRKRASSDQDE